MPESFKNARASERNGPAAAEISNRIVQVMREYLGRGPTRARTTIARNLVVVLLEDTLLKAEKSLVATGQADSVTENRRRYQQTMRDDFVAVVEDVLDSTVIAFLSDHHIEPDIAVEMFVVDALDGDQM